MNIQHPFTFWSDVIKAIIQNKGSLEVIAACEKNNPVDDNAVMILLDVKNLVSAIGGTPAQLNNLPDIIKADGYIRIGYLSWKGFGDIKAEIFNFIEQQEGLFIVGLLTPDGNNGALKFEYYDNNF